MANEVLESIAEDLTHLNEAINRAEELIAVAQDAGEDVSALKARMREMKIKKNKWEESLKKHGYSLPS